MWCRFSITNDLQTWCFVNGYIETRQNFCATCSWCQWSWKKLQLCWWWPNIHLLQKETSMGALNKADTGAPLKRWSKIFNKIPAAIPTSRSSNKVKKMVTRNMANCFTNFKGLYKFFRVGQFDTYSYQHSCKCCIWGIISINGVAKKQKSE